MTRRPLAAPDPQPGDYCLLTVRGLTGFGIKLGQFLLGDTSKFCHVALILDGAAAVEAEPGGARLTTVADLRARGVIRAWSAHDLTADERAAIVAAGHATVGRAYDYWAYLGLALLRVGLRPAWLARRIESGRWLMCSQLVDWAYGQAGVALFTDGRPPGRVTPGDLHYCGRIVNEEPL